MNSDIPTISEVWDAKKQFKDGKCQGTDEIYGEEVKFTLFNDVFNASSHHHLDNLYFTVIMANLVDHLYF